MSPHVSSAQLGVGPRKPNTTTQIMKPDQIDFLWASLGHPPLTLLSFKGCCFAFKTIMSSEPTPGKKASHLVVAEEKLTAVAEPHLMTPPLDRHNNKNKERQTLSPQKSTLCESRAALSLVRFSKKVSQEGPPG